MSQHYTADELRNASNRVMKSLNWMNSQGSRPLSKPAIRNSLGKTEAKISKSSQRRHNRKQRANLGGKKMESLLESLPEVPAVEAPRSAAEMKSQKLQSANSNRHHSRKAEQKVVQHEIASFGIKSLSEIRDKIMQKNHKDSNDS